MRIRSTASLAFQALLRNRMRSLLTTLGVVIGVAAVVTMQAMGWRRGPRYLQLQDDIATVAFWYQTLPLAPYPTLPDVDAREVI